ncbi:spore coat protein [Fictibacillus terranigra]|uniref:Spore coat protein n=1 Tax=Fictibacillus terranigra TaxID=3058424 RepID=A0ABT8E4L4_9BACL|nr:spore coat protein [Fictibacillus sp. CENA-BCM004]MDN4072846.1 spore coat protein [Fictibacillus sp. CENA-BCM004]
MSLFDNISARDVDRFERAAAARAEAAAAEREEEEAAARKCHPCCNGNVSAFNALSGFNAGGLNFDLAQADVAKQVTERCITIKDSCDVFVEVESEQTSIVVQTMINAITVVITATLSNLDLNDDLLQADFLQLFAQKQRTRDNICIENSRGVRIEAETEQAAIAVQTMANVLTVVLTLIASNAS